MPGDVDERGLSAARGLLDSVSSADTGAALAAVRSMTAAPYSNDGPSRRWWILVAAAAVVAVAVVGTVVMLDRRSDSVATVDSEPPSSDPATSSSAAAASSAGVPSTTASPETTSPIVTVPRFVLDGVWMAGPDVVWALVDGRMVRSLDGGLSWRDAGNPGAFEDSRGAFLNAETGWIIGGEGLMVTRDGGNSWQPVDILPDGFDDDAFTGLAAHGERVYLTMWTVPTVTIWSSPADRDEWTATPTEVSIGSGQIPNSQFAFSASATFLVHDNQGAVGALQLIDGEWTDWPVGCTGGDPSLLTSGDPGDVAIICYPGRFDPRDSPVDGSDLNEGSTYMFSSRDDGATFSEVTPPTAFTPDEFGRLRYIVLAHPDPATFVVTPERSDGTNPIYITHDQGTTWSPYASPSSLPVRSLLTSERTWVLVTDRPGAAVSELWVSNDAGVTWTPVDPTATQPASAPTATGTTTTTASVPSYISANSATLAEIEAELADEPAFANGLLLLPDLTTIGDFGDYETIIYDSPAQNGYIVQFTHSVDDSLGGDHSWSINLVVNRRDPALEPLDLTQTGTPVQIGDITAYLGHDATQDCGPVPEDGYSESIYTWVSQDWLFNLQISPIPDCEEISPFTVDDATQLIANAVMCTGLDGQPTCARALSNSNP